MIWNAVIFPAQRRSVEAAEEILTWPETAKASAK